jgi:hypothetical protein
LSCRKSIRAVLLLAAALFLTCRDTPRDNPFDPEGEVLIVQVLSPPEGRIYTTGHPVGFEVKALTGYDSQKAGDTYLWKSDISGILSSERVFSSSLPPGTHRIEVIVTDSLGRRGGSSFLLQIRAATEFGVELLVPAADTAFIVGNQITPQVAEYVPEGFSVVGRLWDFGIGSGIEQSTQQEPGVVVFSQPGIFTVSYQLFDSQGRTAADTVKVEVVAFSQPPDVEIISPGADTTISLGDSLWLQAKAQETAVRIVHTSWVYPDGSGLESRTDTLETPGWVVFGRSGEFQLRFQASDVLGVMAEDTIGVTVHDTLPPPVGKISRPAVDTTVVEGDSIYFAAAVIPSSLIDLTHLWTWGEGNSLPASSLMEPGWRVFADLGAHTVVYLARDLSGRGVPDSLTVSVTANLPPVASIVSPAADIAIGLNGEVNFEGDDSDPEGRTLERVWLWDPASSIVASAADSARVAGTRVFTSTGIFPVVYRVIDDKGLVAEDTLTVTVSNNAQPLAAISAPSTDTTLYAWVPLVFVGTDSDPDGTIASRSWDFGQSGLVVDGDTSRTPSQVSFPVAGDYSVIYSVIDNLSARASDTLAVSVLANNQPQAIILSPVGLISISAGDSISLLAMDLDSDGSVVERVWTYGTGSGLPPDSVSSPDYRVFPNAGSFSVIFRVTDNVGAVASDTLSITVNP